MAFQIIVIFQSKWGGRKHFCNYSGFLFLCCQSTTHLLPDSSVLASLLVCIGVSFRVNPTASFCNCLPSTSADLRILNLLKWDTTIQDKNMPTCSNGQIFGSSEGFSQATMESTFSVSVTRVHNVQSVRSNRPLLLHKGLCVEMVAVRITNSGQESTVKPAWCWRGQRAFLFAGLSKGYASFTLSDLIFRKLCGTTCKLREDVSSIWSSMEGATRAAWLRRHISVSMSCAVFHIITIHVTWKRESITLFHLLLPSVLPLWGT